METPLPMGARRGHGACAIDDQHMIVLGGDDPGTHKPTNDGWIYNIETKHWMELPNPMPAALTRFGICCIQGKHVYVVGGRRSRRRVDSVYRLSLKTFKWHRMSHMSTARDGCAVVIVGTTIYAFGGIDENGRKLSSAERYSIQCNTWTFSPPMSFPRDGHFAAAFDNGDIYIMGDYGGDRSVEVFDTQQKRYRGGSKSLVLPSTVSLAAAVAIWDRFLIIVGGEGRSDGGAGSLIYDRKYHRWIDMNIAVSAHMNVSRGFHSAAVLDGGNRIVVAGGRDQGHSLRYMESVGVMDLLYCSGLLGGDDEDEDDTGTLSSSDVECCRCWF